MINGRHGGRPYRYCYSLVTEPGLVPVQRPAAHRRRDGRRRRSTASTTASSPARRRSRPDGAPTAEDDGYLVTFTTDIADDRSECLVFAAADLAAGPIARVRLPERICSGTHSCWMAQ